MDRIKFVPSRLKSAISIDSDSFINLSFESATKPLNDYVITNIVNQQNQFENERNTVRDYRFSGRLNLYTANELTSITDPLTINQALDEDWDPLFDGNPQVTPNNWLIQLLYPHRKILDFNITHYYYDDNNVLNTIQSKSEQGPQIKKMGLTTPVGEEQKVYVNGVQKHNLNIDDFVYVYDNSVLSNPYTGIHRIITLGIDGQNLDSDFVLDTPYINDYSFPSNYRKVYNPSQADLNFENSIEVNIVTASDANGGTLGTFGPNDVIYTLIQSQTPHNLTVVSGSTGNPFIDLRGGGLLNGIFEVVSIINEYLFTIRLTYFTNKGQSQTFNINRPRFRSLDGTPSEYYVRKYKVLTTNDYDVYKCAFSTSIYPKTIVNELGISNDTWLFHFNKDINVGELLDHNNKPITELYLGLIKRAGQNSFSWSKVVAGWDFNRELINTINGLETISNFVSGGVGTIEKPNELFDYVGDYVEYNKTEIEEKIVSKIVHRFGKITDPNGEGYYLEPFKKMRIMVFSNIIETSSIDEPTEGIPNYAETYPDGTIAWRDLLFIGYLEPENNNGVDYPFVNGKHYFHGNYNFYIRRQLVPVDKIIDQDDVKISKIQDVC
jgi:hypothetical protein